MPAGHVSRYGEAQARAALVAAAGVVQAHEAFEDPLTLGLRDARPVVADRDHHAAAFRTHRDGDRTLRVTLRVVQQISDDPCQLTA